MKTNKRSEMLTFESVLAQLRHGYALMVADERAWEAVQRKRFAEGLLGPQIKKLEKLARDFDERTDDLLVALSANARHRERFKEAEQQLLAQAPNIASASQARRIIFTVFHKPED